MDPFTQRMLERARARQEKIDQKLACSGQTVPKRKPLTENISVIKNASPIRSPSKAKESVLSPRKSLKSESPAKTVTRRPSLQKSQNAVASPQKSRNDVVVTKKEFSSPRGSIGRRNSDVSLEINITHRNDIKVDVQIEEIDAPISVVYNTNSDSDSNVVIKEIEDGSTKMPLEQAPEETEHKMEKAGTRHNFKSRLDRLGNLYSDEPNLSSPIHRTEQDFSAATPPKQQPVREKAPDGKRKFGRLAALADQINNWEDDLTHHTFNPEPVKKTTKAEKKHEKLDASTLDVSIHSFNDINNVLKKTPAKSAQPSKASNTRQSSKPSVNECQRLQRQIIAELEGEGYRRVSAGKSRLVYDFTATENADPARQEPKRASTTPSAAPAPNMAAMVASGPPVAATVTKKPSLKKYRAPTPPSKTQLGDDEDKDKENNAVQAEQESDDASDCIQTKPEPADQKPAAEKGSPAAKRLAPKLNGNVDRSSVLSRAAMFEAGSPRNKDPAEMSLRERKALFEKNKGAAIVPKAPFGMAPSAKTLHGDNKDKAKSQTSAKTTPTKSNISNNSRANSKDSLADDNVSQTSVGGIKGKLAALFSKEQTISETTIANKFKQEREKEMEMLQNRFNYKPPKETPAHDNGDSDDEQSDNDRSEKAPLMGSALNLANAAKKPEIIANVPKVTFDDKTKAQELIDKEAEKEKVVGSQPVKRRSSQDSPVVLSVLEDVKRIKVNSKKEPLTNGLVLQQPGLYPHLSDIETDNSNTQEEFSDCGGSSTDERLNDNLNKSDNWAETSFGREVMNVVKKNNTSYKKAVRESDSDDTHSACDSELDDMLDEALNEDGPTPPKVNKHGSVTSSSSFVYQEKAQFKSPQKPKPPQHPTTPRVDRGNELVHSVSFYRRMQNASSTPTTPMRVVRHGSPEREIPATPDEPAAAVTVRQRVKELQNEIAKQQTVISQASQALNLCASTIEFSGSTEQAEGERLLLLATHRRQACLHEVQRLQVEGAGPAATAGMASLHIHGLSVPLRRDYVRQLNAAHYQACLHEVQRLQVEGAGPAATAGMASLHIHGLSVPLRRDYVRQLNADGAVGHHAVCLLKCRDRVLASSMPRTQPSAALLHFPDEIRMDHLTSDFKVTVEVYLLQASKESLPHDVKYHINNKKSNSKLLTPKSKVSELKAPRVQSPAGPLSVRSPQFQLHGYCIFALQQASRKTFTLNKAPYSRTNMSELKAPRVQSPAGPLSVRSPQFQLHGYCIFALQQASRKTFTLNKVPCGSPLEGSVNIDIKARVRVDAPPPHAAFLTAFDDVSGLGAWHRRWFRLCAPTLAYWKYPDDVTKKLVNNSPFTIKNHPHAAFLTAFDDVSGLGAWHRRWFRLCAPTLAYWKYPDDVTKKLPIGDIDLSTIVSDKVVRAPRDLCARPNTIMLEAAVPAGLIVPDSGSLVYVRRPDGSLVRRHLLAADTPKDRDMWLDCLNKALEYVRCCATDDD